MLCDKGMLNMYPPYLLMFWFLASIYKSLEDFSSPLVIIPHHQIFSIMMYMKYNSSMKDANY